MDIENEIKIRKKCANCGYLYDYQVSKLNTNKHCIKCGSNALDVLKKEDLK